MFRRALALSLLVGSLGAASVATVAVPSSAQDDEMIVRVVFDDRMSSLFKDESWTKRDGLSRQAVRSGKNSMAFEADWWGGVAFHGDLVDLRGATAVSMWLSGGTAGGQSVKVSLKVNGKQSDRIVRGLDQPWQEVRIPLGEIGGAPSVRADVFVSVAADVDADQPTVYLDDLYFVGPATSGTRPAGNRPFPGGLVSFTFDDNAAGQAAIARPLLNAAGFKGTFYTPTSFIQPDNEAALGWSQMKAMVAEGHEMAGHSITHKDMPTLGIGELERELTEPIGTIAAQTGAKVRSFATPSGLYTQREFPYMEKYYDSHRTAFIGANDVAMDRYQLYAVSGDGDVNKIIADIEDAVASDRWVILLYHQVNESGQGFFAASRANLAKTIDAVRSRGIPVARVDEGVDRLKKPVLVTARPNSNGKPKAILTLEQAKVAPASEPVTAPSGPVASEPLAITPAPVNPAPSSKLSPVGKPVPQGKPLPQGKAKGSFVLFSDALAPGVEDWSWAKHSLVATKPARGKASIIADLSEWKGVYFHGTADLRGVTTLEMYVYGGSKGGQNLKVLGRSGSAEFKTVGVGKIKPNSWSKVRIPLTGLGISPAVGLFEIQVADNSGKVQEPVALDDIRFTR
jgi:peptidoglycan/xylan/chitin deacetylase (PgdA/CDA1 family)